MFFFQKNKTIKDNKIQHFLAYNKKRLYTFQYEQQLKCTIYITNMLAHNHHIMRICYGIAYYQNQSLCFLICRTLDSSRRRVWIRRTLDSRRRRVWIRRTLWQDDQARWRQVCILLKRLCVARLRFRLHYRLEAGSWGFRVWAVSINHGLIYWLRAAWSINKDFRAAIRHGWLMYRNWTCRRWLV